MYPNITKVPRYLIIETINKSMAVAAQVLHPIFRRPGLPTCEAILVFLDREKNKVFENRPKT